MLYGDLAIAVSRPGGVHWLVKQGNVIGSLETLLGPVDEGIRMASFEAGPGWRLPPLSDDGPEVVLWGRGPLGSARAKGVALNHLRRERALARARSGAVSPYVLLAAHYVEPRTLRYASKRARARTRFLSGVVAELSRAGRYNRTLDAALQDAEAIASGRLTLTSGGGALMGTRTAAGQRAIFRAGAAGGRGGPVAEACALQTLAVHGVERVPRLLGAGQTRAVVWALESVIAGERTFPLRERALRDVAGMFAGLPGGEAGARAARDDLEAVATALPKRAAALRSLFDEARPVLESLPGVMRHGDLWPGNVLTSGGRLAGVVDWDSWAPDGVPGADLLYLVTGCAWLERRRTLGSVWQEAPWGSELYRSLMGSYWPRLGVEPRPDTLEVVGLTTWLSQVRSHLDKSPWLAGRTRWVEANVDGVLDFFTARWAAA
ncbi:MAG TPA: phosphotransferase [Actinomycetota bacterium]|jgi:hypothetical protein|nr:phosphotransferase [Actinomycetota bacterium]